MDWPRRKSKRIWTRQTPTAKLTRPAPLTPPPRFVKKVTVCEFVYFQSERTRCLLFCRSSFDGYRFYGRLSQLFRSAPSAPTLLLSRITDSIVAVGSRCFCTAGADGRTAGADVTAPESDYLPHSRSTETADDFDFLTRLRFHGFFREFRRYASHSNRESTNVGPVF